MAAQNSASRLRKDGSQKSDASSMISLRDESSVRNNGISRTVSAEAPSTHSLYIRQPAGDSRVELKPGDQGRPSITMQPISPVPRRLGAEDDSGIAKPEVKGRRTPHGAKSVDGAKRMEEEEENLRQQIEEIDGQIETLKDLASNLSKRNQELNAESLELEAAWRNELRELDTQRHALNANRAFVAREGTVDAQGLIQAFNDLNSSIGDFSYEVLRGLDAATEGRVLEKKHYQQIDQVFRNESLKKFLESVSNLQLTTMDILDPIVQYALCDQLMHTIFRPFAPGLDMDRSLSLQNMYQKMRNNEPQERSARWRSITYTHVATMRAETFLQDAVTQYISGISSVLSILSEKPDTKLPPEYTETATKIFQSAIKVQDRAKKEYVSFDYDIKSVLYDTAFDSMTMEASQGGSNPPKKVWLTIGLGIVATKGVVAENRSVTIERTVPVKTLVLCDNWDPNA